MGVWVGILGRNRVERERDVADFLPFLLRLAIIGLEESEARGGTEFSRRHYRGASIQGIDHRRTKRRGEQG